MAYVDAYQRGWNLEQLQFEIINDLEGARKALTTHQAQVFFWEKYTTQPYVDKGEFRRIGVRPTPWACFVLAVRSELLETIPETIKAIQHIVNQSCSQMMQRKDLPQFISQQYGLKQNQAEEWLKITQWETQAKIDPTSLENVANYLKMIRMIPNEFQIKNIIY